MDRLVVGDSNDAIPIWLLGASMWPSFLQRLSPAQQKFLNALDFTQTAGRHALVPAEDGGLSCVPFGIDEDVSSRDPFLPGKLSTILPPGRYRLANEPPGGADELRLCYISWILSAYGFPASKRQESPRVVLEVPIAAEAERANRIASAVTFGRDLVNAPTNEMGPNNLRDAAVAEARFYGAECRLIRGDELMQQFPLINAVGRGAEQEPCLVDFVWGEPNAPKITLVGKGVCFDTGGLDIKPPQAMALMKKDMAGAATALALARMVMGAGLPIRLRVLLPIVENSISARAFRPGDVYSSRKGLTVEIGNTDAEGRLILADALSLADEENPDMLLDFATLTGAARVALGPDLPPFYTFDDGLAAKIEATGRSTHDPVWRMPLWPRYASQLKSKVASTNNISSSPFAGSIIAALFLAQFVSNCRSWAHFDIYGWNLTTDPGRPEGGEIQTARLLFDLLERCFATLGGR